MQHSGEYRETAFFCDILIEQGVDKKEIKEIARQSGLVYVPKMRRFPSNLLHHYSERIIQELRFDKKRNHYACMQRFYDTLKQRFPNRSLTFAEKMHEEIDRGHGLEALIKEK